MIDEYLTPKNLEGWKQQCIHLECEIQRYDDLRKSVSKQFRLVKSGNKHCPVCDRCGCWDHDEYTNCVRCHVPTSNGNLYCECHKFVYQIQHELNKLYLFIAIYYNKHGWPKTMGYLELSAAFAKAMENQSK